MWARSKVTETWCAFTHKLVCMNIITWPTAYCFSSNIFFRLFLVCMITFECFDILFRNFTYGLLVYCFSRPSDIQDGRHHSHLGKQIATFVLALLMFWAISNQKQIFKVKNWDFPCLRDNFRTLRYSVSKLFIWIY